MSNIKKKSVRLRRAAYLLPLVTGPLELDGSDQEVRADLSGLHKGYVELPELLLLVRLGPVALALVLTSLLISE